MSQTTPQESAELHRFHEKVALSFEDTHTLYLTPNMARLVAEALTQLADDCDAVKFTKSNISTLRFIN